MESSAQRGRPVDMVRLCGKKNEFMQGSQAGKDISYTERLHD